MELAVNDARVGVIVGQRYEILTRISRGGMATVYRALDVRLDREIAVKVMHPHLAESPRFLSRFQSEARAAARLTHPAIVAVADQGVDSETVWLAMELLPGRTLRDELGDRGSFTLAEAAVVMECLLSGLGAAHDAGIIHRDIKPENILVTGAAPGGPQPAYKVSDFGLARALSGVGSLTESVLGTPAYIAPELARDGRVDERVDLYAAGIVFFELLTGRQPFTGDSAVQVILAHINTDVPPVSRAIGQAFGEQSDEVDSLVSWACERDPELRPATAADFLAELRSVLAAVPSQVLHARREAGRAAAATPENRWFDTIGIDDLSVTAGNQQTVDLRREDIGDTRSATARAAELLESAAFDPDGEQTEPTRRVVVSSAVRGDYVAAEDADGPGYGRVGHGSTVYEGVQDHRADHDTAHHATADHDPADAGQGDETGWDRSSGRSPGRNGTGRGGRRRFEVGPQATRRRTEQTLGIALLLAMVAALVAAGVIWWTQVGPGAYTTTAPVLGLEPAAAEDVLAEAGLRLQTEDVFDDVVPEGTIVSTDPVPGAQVRKGGTVTADVSRGPAAVPVPVVVGLTLEAASATLAQAGLPAPRPVEEFDDAAPVGTVAASDPAAGVEAERDQVVTLTISRGPEPREVPTVVGESREGAESALAALGLAVGTVTEQYDPSVAAGVVLSQTPSSGTLLPGGTVNLLLSLGAEPVAVPDVRNLTSDEASRVLRDAGFEVEETGTTFLDRVWQQAPEPGTPAARGTVVLITTF